MTFATFALHTDWPIHLPSQCIACHVVSLVTGHSNLDYWYYDYYCYYSSRHLLELHRSTGIDGLGSIKWDVSLCLLAVYLICYFSLWKGISTSGKVSFNNIIKFFFNYIFVVATYYRSINYFLYHISYHHNDMHYDSFLKLKYNTDTNFTTLCHLHRHHLQ